MTYPKPDRSNYIPNHEKTSDNDAVDLGWNEGLLSDGRPYRLEWWTRGELTGLTFFLSTLGLEAFSNEQFVALLEREQLITFEPGMRWSAYAMSFTDAAGQSMWSVNLVLGDKYTVFLRCAVRLLPYSR